MMREDELKSISEPFVQLTPVCVSLATLLLLSDMISYVIFKYSIPMAKFQTLAMTSSVKSLLGIEEETI